MNGSFRRTPQSCAQLTVHIRGVLQNLRAVRKRVPYSLCLARHTHPHTSEHAENLLNWQGSTAAPSDSTERHLPIQAHVWLSTDQQQPSDSDFIPKLHTWTLQLGPRPCPNDRPTHDQQMLAAELEKESHIAIITSS